MRKNLGSLLRLFSTILIPVIILGVIFSMINFAEIITVIKNADLKYLLTAVFISIVSTIFVSADKWRRVLECMGDKLEYKEALFIKAGIAPLSIIFPFRSGELFKVLYLKRKYGFFLREILSSLAFDKILNIFAMIFFLFIGINFVGVDVPFQMSGFILALGILFVCRKRIRFLLHSFTKMAHPYLHKVIKQLGETFEKISLKDKIYLGIYSIFLGFLELISFYVLFRALGVNIPFYIIPAYASLVILISDIPVSIMGIGLRESAVLYIFSGYASAGILVSLGILVMLINHLLPKVAGIFFLRPFLNSLMAAFDFK